MLGRPYWWGERLFGCVLSSVYFIQRLFCGCVFVRVFVLYGG